MDELSDEKWAWIQLAEIAGVGDSTFDLLLDSFGSVRAALSAPPNKLMKSGLSSKLSHLITSSAKKFNKEMYRTVISTGVIPIFSTDQLYPRKLLKVTHPPHILWCYGKLELLSSYPLICVVGTRHITQYGLLQTERFVQYFCSCGVTIVSGLAIGVDSVAHLSALSFYGNTIGVVGCGLWTALRERKDEVFQKVRQQGLLISTFSPFVPPTKSTFPQRNRFMAAFSDAVLVVEAGDRSGSLITANYAKVFGTPLYAIPGDIGKWRSSGCNRLIEDSIAKISINPKRIVHDILFRNSQRKEKKEKEVERCQVSSEKEKKVFDVLGKGDLTLEQISQKTGIDERDILKILGGLEIEGLVINRLGIYSRT